MLEKCKVCGQLDYPNFNKTLAGSVCDHCVSCLGNLHPDFTSAEEKSFLIINLIKRIERLEEKT